MLYRSHKPKLVLANSAKDFHLHKTDSWDVCEHMLEHPDEYDKAISKGWHRAVCYKEPILGLPLIPREVKLPPHQKYLQDLVLVTQTGMHGACRVECGDPCHQDGCEIHAEHKTRHWRESFGWRREPAPTCDFDLDISNNDAEIDGSFYALIHRFRTDTKTYAPDLDNCGFVTNRLVAEQLRAKGVLNVAFNIIFASESFADAVPLIKMKYHKSHLRDTDIRSFVSTHAHTLGNE